MNLHNYATQKIAYIFIVYIKIYISMCIYGFTIVESSMKLNQSRTEGRKTERMEEKKCSSSIPAVSIVIDDLCT